MGKFLPNDEANNGVLWGNILSPIGINGNLQKAFESLFLALKRPKTASDDVKIASLMIRILINKFCQ